MPVLSDDEVDRRLAAMEGWIREQNAITKRFGGRDGFMGSVGLVNAIAVPAEDMDHHPDLAISWDTVTVTLSTHSEGGITEKDLKLAEQIDFATSSR